MDLRTIYVERIPVKKSAAVLTKQFGPCEKVIIPPEAVNPMSDYAFVVFESVAGCASALAKFADSFRPVTVDTNLLEYLEQEDQDAEADGGNKEVELLGKVRVLSKCRWIELSEEYQAALAARHEQLHKVTHQAVGTHSAEYTAKVVGRFWDVHPATNTKILKRLFEMVAPVAFVEFRRNNGTGYVRFKTSHGAHLASTYFNTEYIVQKNANDCGTLLMQNSKSKGKAKQSAVANAVKTAPGFVDEWAELAGDEEQDTSSPHMADDAEPPPKYPNIKLKLLTGHEESTYWDMIAGKRQDKTAHTSHTSHGPPARPPAETQNPVHVKFTASDDEEEPQAERKVERPANDRQKDRAEDDNQKKSGEDRPVKALKSSETLASEARQRVNDDAVSTQMKKKFDQKKQAVEKRDETDGQSPSSKDMQSNPVSVGSPASKMQGDCDEGALARKPKQKQVRKKRGRDDLGSEEQPTLSRKRAK
ncbi:hypothetical protein HDU86_004680 [Geranomyces michiganensis]|nr:hypothetical protein HDU86_004680 [Geranomyces michiganensis]